MASDAERTRRLVADLLHLGRNCDMEVYSVEIERTAALLAQVRLGEAKWWGELKEHYVVAEICEQKAKERLADLERAAGAEK